VCSELACPKRTCFDTIMADIASCTSDFRAFVILTVFGPAYPLVFTRAQFGDLSMCLIVFSHVRSPQQFFFLVIVALLMITVIKIKIVHVLSVRCYRNVLSPLIPMC